MREIKFRAWDTEKNKMVKIDTIDFYNGNVNDVDFYNQEIHFGYSTVLMQYTGLKEKNDTEIYEGDVVQYLKHNRIYHEYENECAYVEYNESKCRFELNKGKGNNETFCSFSKFGTDEEQVEVIGNVFEDGELLNDS